MKTHKVIDLVYHEDEGNIAFVGTADECQEFVAQQGFGYEGFGYEITKLTPEEYEIHNS